MNRLITYLFSHKKQTKELGWFRFALYAFIIYKVYVYVVHYKELFSSQSLIYHAVKHINPLVDLTFYLNNHYAAGIAPFFILGTLFCALLGIFKQSNYISNIVLWLLIINLTNFLYPTLTAGDYLLNQLLFFNIFFSFKTSEKPAVNDFKTALHNTALVGIKLQVCLAYVMAAWFKLDDASWLSGMAVYQTFRIPEYSTPLLASLPLSICMILNYATIAYQLLFPAFIWFRPLKIYLLAFGIVQHLAIALGMGLFSFGIIMVICYILFLKYDGASVEHRVIL
jgi:hypothetical protein